MLVRTMLTVLALLLGMAGAAAKEAISVEVGKSRLIRVEDKEPAVVVVGNPAIADVVVEKSGVIFVLGLEPGETDLWVLDDEGKEVMHRPLIITPLSSRQLSLHRGPAESTLACSPRCSRVPTPAGSGRVGGGRGGTVVVEGNPPQATPQVSTEDLIEALRNLIPDLGEVPGGQPKSGTGQ
jgi:hypothetical protein